MRFYPPLGLTCLLFLGAACTTTNTYIRDTAWQGRTVPSAETLEYQVFLVGNAGLPKPDTPTPALDLLKQKLDTADKNSTVVFLGDNLYPTGLPDSADAARATAEQRLIRLMDTVEDFKGEIVFIPGNRDWNNSAWNGWAALQRQEAFVEAYLDRGNTFLPDNGFAGPVELRLTRNLRLIVLDTEWWLTEAQKPFGDTGDYDLEEAGDILLQLDDIIKRNRKRDLLVVGHHPIFSNGRHGGYFPPRRHLLPVPILGSIYPLYRRFFGRPQDLSHPRYASLRQGLHQIFEAHEGLVYASAHEHSLQYFADHHQHYIVSGSAVDADFVASGRGADFTANKLGFVVLNYYEDGSAWMEAWTTESGDGAGTLLYRKQLNGPALDRVDAELPVADVNAPDYRDSTRTVAPNPGYRAGGLKSLFLGKHHRDIWATAVEVPYLDVGKEAGGLTPIKRGGGLQSTSLRLAGADGHQYVLRSVDKDPSKALARSLQKSIAADIARDQTSSQHPFGAYIVPPLADAVGIYHTNPRMVYVPPDPRLGVYAEVIGGMLMLFEERPNNDMSHAPYFGNSEEIVGAPDMYRKVNDDNDHYVDQRFFARNRLFDMLLGDWDRHIDQWRWATFEAGDRTVYRAIPRDRDQAFNRLSGMPGLVKPFTKWQDFTEDYGTLPGLAFNGREQDHRFISELTLDDWLAIADSIQTSLTDDVIEAAFRQWPEPVFEAHGKRVIEIFQVRRDKLADVARSFYRLHAHAVDIVGSNKHERFEVTRVNDDETEVVMYKTSKEGEIRAERYRRRFKYDETNEIRLYGLDGNDRFIISGPASKGIRIRVIGGGGDDWLTDTSTGGKSWFYDTNAGATFEPGPHTRMHNSDDPAVNAYDGHFEFSRLLPTAFFGYHEDDGIFIGGGATFTRLGFRKKPYARRQTLLANISTSTGAVNLRYTARHVELVGGWNLLMDARALLPGNFRNFYGLGNETTNTAEDEDYYRARLTQFSFAPSLTRGIPGFYEAGIGPTFEFTRVSEDDDRFLVQAGVPKEIFERDQIFVGIEGMLNIENKDHPTNPHQGYQWMSQADVNVGLGKTNDSYTQLASSLSLYFSPGLAQRITLAARVGAAHTFGDFPFYRANTLGSKTNLRGYASTRFAGRSSFYQNVDLRIKLFDFSAHLASGEFGILGFVDNGRVWTDNETSTLWHHGYGGGIWMNLFDQAILAGTLGFSEEDRLFGLQLGFLY